MATNRNTRGKRWVFTLNNYTDDEVSSLVTLCEPLTEYLVFGYEVGEGGTPHLQGFVIFNDRTRFGRVKELIGQRASLQIARGTNTEASAYCKKDEDYEEFGDVNPVQQGRRSDWDRYREWVLDLGRVPTNREIVSSDYIGLLGRYGWECLRRIAVDLVEPPTLVGDDETPRLGFQSLVIDRVTNSITNGAPPRSIDFVVDPEGSTGKTWIGRYLLTKYPEKVQYLTVGKRDDMAYAIDELKSVYLFDVPRNQMEFFQYSIVEMLKNQLIFSPKYQSSIKTLYNVPHVVVLCNEAPNMTALTDDRFNIIDVN